LTAAPLITGHTRLAAVIGDPVRHSLSPLMYNAAFAAQGLDWAFGAFEVPDGGGADAVAAMRTLGLAGLAVTMPHKVSVAGAVDALTPAAEALGAVNCVVPSPEGLVGHNTDGDGFVDALRDDEGVDPGGLACLVLGSGGAARAVVRALGAAGAASVVVVARRPEAAAETARLAGAVGRVGTEEAVDEAQLVVNATPLGMAGIATLDGGLLPVDPARLGAGQVVVDLVYHPLVTPLLTEARARGAIAVNGLGMLLHQAGRNFTLWTGDIAPLPEMSAAVVRALAERES
jgi:shikimate dehydrogenase